jgi:hypothetical protein
MEMNVRNNEIVLRIPNKNAGKFRFKTRKGNIGFGESFATTSRIFTKKVYLEWQIGYDVMHNQLNMKPTTLQHLTFIGANGATKHPYELSELLYNAIRIGILSVNKVNALRQDIELFERLFNDEFTIDIHETKQTNYNGLGYMRGDIVLPSFFHTCDEYGTSIEVAIKQQMYATGVQPMVYIAIPITEFSNAEEALGNTSRAFGSFEFIFNAKNVDIILNAFKVFGMCSTAHKHDVLEIIDCILADF